MAFSVYRYIVGLVALGRDDRDESCGSEVLPSMYTDLTYFRKWIMQNIRELESITTKNCKISGVIHKLMKQKINYNNNEEIEDGAGLLNDDCKM